MKQINCTVTLDGDIKKLQWLDVKSGAVVKEAYQTLSLDGNYKGIYKTIEEAKGAE